MEGEESDINEDYRFFYMKRTSFYLLLLIFSVQFSMFSELRAQDENAAFYIYQNDGHFDGFFYDEVLKMSYSKTDTAGVEYDVFITQEIVTADSTYRIMLSAIDSVSFVQPEIRMNPKVRDVRKEGMLAYLTARDRNALTLSFSSSTPENLRPKVGDVLVDFDLDEGFSLRVTEINSQGSSLVVKCEDIESIQDIFEQFVTVEQYSADKEGNLVRRRVAGCPELTVSRIRRKEEFNFNLFNFSLSGHLPIYAGNNATVTLDANLAVAANLKASWKFPSTYARLVNGDKDYVGITLTLNNELSAGLTFDGKIGDVFPTGVGEFGKLPLPAAAPIFVIDFGPDGMVRGEIHGKYSFSTPKFKGRVWGRLEFNDWSPSMKFGCGTPPGEREPKEEETAENPWGASFEFNGFVQGGIQFPLKLKTNKLLEKILKCEVGTTVYVGPKLSGVLSADLLADNVYDKYKDSKLSLSYLCADYETKAVMGAFWGSDDTITIADGSLSLLSDIEAYLFPEFSLNVSANKDGSTFTVTPSRNIFFPVGVGIAVYDDDDLVFGKFFDEPYSMNQTRSKYWQFSSDWRKQPKGELFVPIYDLGAGEYVARPRLSILGIPIKASPEKKFEVPGPYIKYKYAEVYCLPGREADKIPVKTNCSNLTLEGGDISGLTYSVRAEYKADPKSNRGLCEFVPDSFPGIGQRFYQGFLKGTFDNEEFSSWGPNIFVTQYGDGEINKLRFSHPLCSKESNGRFGTNYIFMPCSYEISGSDTHVQSSGTQQVGDGSLTWAIELDNMRSLEKSQNNKYVLSSSHRNGSIYHRYEMPNFYQRKNLTFRDHLFARKKTETTGNTEYLVISDVAVETSYKYERVNNNKIITDYNQTVTVTYENGETEDFMFDTPDESEGIELFYVEENKN